MSMWHYVQAGIRQGPVSTEELRSLLASGQIQPTDSVWREGMSGWAAINQVPELSGIISQPPRMQASYPGTAVHPAAQPGNFSVGLRIAAIVGAGLAMIAFFVPYFYVWATWYSPKPDPTPFGEVQKIDPVTRSGLPFGWSFWWSILIFVFAFFPLIAAILDLALRSRTLRAVSKWVMLGCFSVITILSLVHMILAVFGISLGSVYVSNADDLDDPRPLSGYYEVMDATKRNERARVRNAPKEEKERIDKRNAETYIGVSAVPIGSAVAFAGGAVGLIASLMIISKKS